MSGEIEKRGPVSDAPAPAERAQEVHERIRTGCEAVRRAWVPLAALLCEFHGGRMWRECGYETFAEWLGTPEIGLSRSYANALIEVYGELTRRGLDAEQLGAYDPTKVYEVLPAVHAGDVSLDDALADCKSLSRSDLRAKYRNQLPEKTGEGGGGNKGRSLVECEQCGKMREADEEPCDAAPTPGQRTFDDEEAVS